MSETPETPETPETLETLETLDDLKQECIELYKLTVDLGMQHSMLMIKQNETKNKLKKMISRSNELSVEGIEKRAVMFGFFNML